MAFPWLSEKNWADGSTGQWDSETDTSSYLNVRSYDYLARRIPRVMPFRGNYVGEINFGTKSTSTNAAYVAETGDLDTACAADGGAYCRFYIYCASKPAWTMANNDEFTVLGLYASTTLEAGINIKYTTAAGYAILATDGSSTASSILTFDQWLCCEAYFNIDKGAENDGTIDFYINGSQVESQITGADQGGITEYRYGCNGPDAGTTSGIYYLGPIWFDDARIYPLAERYPFNRPVTLNEQLFVGPGCIDSAAIHSTGASDSLKLYDTDQSSALIASNCKAELSTSTYVNVQGPIQFNRGCYAVISGTDARGQVILTADSDIPGVFGPPYYSESGWRRWSARREARVPDL